MTVTQQQSKRGRPPLISYDEQQRWRVTYGLENLHHPSIVFVNNMVKDGIIKSDEEFATYLLYISCESRINATHFGNSIYKDVHNDYGYGEASKFTYDIINHKPEMFKEWKRVSETYLKSCFNSPRPQIDRINEDPSIGYRISNIQCLPADENVKKGTSKPQYLFDLNDPQNISFRKFDTRQDALDFLKIKSKSDTGRLVEVDGRKYLIQSADITEGKREFEENEVDESDESKWQSLFIPVATLKLPDGSIGYLNQEVKVSQIKIGLKKLG